jgi:iron complex outermembrane receptor protein
VEPQFIPELSAFQFINLTRARIRGAELLVGIRSLEKQHNLQVGYTFLDPEDLDAGRPLLYRSRHLLQVNGSLQVTSRLLAGFDFRASDAPERVDTDFSLFVEDADLFPVQYVTNARMSYLFTRPERGFGFTASLVVNNLFDYYYVERPAILAPPRHGQVVLEFSF